MQDPPQVPAGLTNVEKVRNLARRYDWTDGDNLLWQELLLDADFTAEEVRRLVAELDTLPLDRFMGLQLLLYRLGYLQLDVDALVASPDTDLAFVSAMCSWFRDYISLPAAMIAWHRALACRDEMAPWIRAGVQLALFVGKDDVGLLSDEDRTLHAAALSRNAFRESDEVDPFAELPVDIVAARTWLDTQQEPAALRTFGGGAMIRAADARKVYNDAAALDWASFAVRALEAAAREEQGWLQPMTFRTWIIEHFGAADGVRDPDAVFRWVRRLAANASPGQLQQRASAVSRGHADGRREEVFEEMRALNLLKNSLSVVARLRSVGVDPPADLVALLDVRDALP